LNASRVIPVVCEKSFADFLVGDGLPFFVDLTFLFPLLEGNPDPREVRAALEKLVLAIIIGVDRVAGSWEDVW